MPVRTKSVRGLPDQTYLELVRSLFAALAPMTIMAALFIVVATMAFRDRPDAALAVLGIGGGVASLARVAVTLLFKRGAAVVDRPSAIRAERTFGVTCLIFAAILGLFAARAFGVCSIEIQMVVAPLVVGYAAGVAAGVSLRPGISIPALLFAVVPTAAAAASTGDAAHAVLALMLVTMLTGGVGSMLARYQSVVEKAAMRQTFASLARTDHLTGLANRLALGEMFEREMKANGAARLAVHCLDLDRFKAVNDQLGHPAGDALLKQVADRLRAVCREGDVVARIGGDEFVVLQTGFNHPDEVDFIARRIVRSLGRPYDVDGHRVVIGASLGYALPNGREDDLSRLLGGADRALYEIKRDGGGAAAQAGGEDRGRGTAA